MKLYYYLIRKLMRFVTEYIAPLHSPWTHKRLLFDDCCKIFAQLQIGDVLLIRTNGELAAALIPDYWKHAALYIGNGKIIDATTPGVHIRHLEDLVLKTDNICILRANQINYNNRRKAAKIAVQYEGRPYDESFDVHDTKELYCSELIYQVYNQIVPNYLELHKRLGLDTITPNDLYSESDKFSIVYENSVK